MRKIWVHPFYGTSTTFPIAHWLVSYKISIYKFSSSAIVIFSRRLHCLLYYNVFFLWKNIFFGTLRNFLPFLLDDEGGAVSIQSFISMNCEFGNLSCWWIFNPLMYLMNCSRFPESSWSTRGIFRGTFCHRNWCLEVGELYVVFSSPASTSSKPSYQMPEMEVNRSYFAERHQQEGPGLETTRRGRLPENFRRQTKKGAYWTGKTWR